MFVIHAQVLQCYHKLHYRIYSIKRPGCLLNFWTLRVGAYSRWGFIRGWVLIKFLPFSASSKFILQQNNKIIMRKREDVPKQIFNCSLKVSLKY